MAIIQSKQIENAYIRRDGVGSAPTADISWGTTNRIIDLEDPVNAQDAATKFYVDALAEGLSWKDSVRAATLVSGTLASDFENGDTIDGVLLVTGNRILLKNQGTVAENGIYTVNVSGAPTRAVDADATAELLGAAVFVQEGSQMDTMWTQTGDGVTFATVSTWVQFSSAATLVGGAGINIGSGVVDVALVAAASGLELTPAGPTGELRIDCDGDSTAIGAGGLKAAVPTTNNKYMTPAATALDFDTTSLTITSTPGGDGYVNIFVNGARQHLGDGVKTRDGYFSSDGGTTAKTIATITAGDTLYWVGSVAGFQLAVTDKMDFEYNVA